MGNAPSVPDSEACFQERRGESYDGSPASSSSPGRRRRSRKQIPTEGDEWYGYNAESGMSLAAPRAPITRNSSGVSGATSSTRTSSAQDYRPRIRPGDKMFMGDNGWQKSTNKKQKFYPDVCNSVGHIGLQQPRNFLLTAMGTRGDVQPICVIGKKLQDDGHNVRIAADPFFKPSIESQGLRFFPMRGFDPVELMKKQHGHQPWYGYMVEDTSEHLRQFKIMFEDNLRSAVEPWDDGEQFIADAFIISQHMYGIWPIAAKLQAPIYVFNTYPVVSTSEFRAPFSIVMETKYGGNILTDNALVNKASYKIYDFAFETFLGPIFKEHCKNIGIEFPIPTPGWQKKHRIPNFGIWSPSVISKPDDWHENCVIVGNVDRAGGLSELPTDLVEWIDDVRDGGPVFFGFGSVAEAEQLRPVWRSVLQAIKRLGRRAVIHISVTDAHIVKEVGAEEGIDDEQVFVLDRPVAHSELFKKCCTIVCAGGPGTWLTALKNGKPTCCITFVVDQPFWGDRLTYLHLGAHIRSNAVTTADLVDALQVCFTKKVVESCIAYKNKINNEKNGTNEFVKEVYARLPQRAVDYDRLIRECDDSFFSVFGSTY